MSLETVKKFSETADTDPALQVKLGVVSKSGRTRDDQIAEIVKIADAAGFKFTPQDYESFVKEQDAQMESAMQFIQKAKTDPILKAKLMAIPRGSSYEKSIDEVLKIAAGAGFHFTARAYDAAAYAALAQENPQGELSEKDLEKVAGGDYNTCRTTYYYYYCSVGSRGSGASEPTLQHEAPHAS